MRVAALPALAAALALVGCVAAPPLGPTVMASPGKDKSFDAFQRDDGTCRQYASQSIGYGSPAEAAQQSAAGSAAAGTVLGAAAGAAIGAAAGNPAAGAAIGAGSGLFLGGTSGLGAAQYSASALQAQYDRSYAMCMQANGDNVQMASSAGPYGYYPYGYGGYPSYPYAYYPYPYAYPYPYPAFYGPPVSLGFGFAFGGHHH